MRTFYFISDLHIGGDEALGVCDFEKELIDFLETLAAKTDEEAELVIIGDAFGLVLDPGELTGQKEDEYIDAAEHVFKTAPDVAVFIYGHTHAPSLRRIGARAVVNTGTWIKKLESVAPRFGIVPGIYVPSYCLNYFRIHGADGKVVIEYQKIDKKPARELTLLQRLLAPRGRGASLEPIPERTVLSSDS